MSNADDRCAFLLQSGAPCGVWRDTHPMIPFKPEFHHPFVEPAPRPAPSGDEEKVREVVEKWMDKLPGVSSFDIAAIAKAGYAAGKADGAREACVDAATFIKERTKSLSPSERLLHVAIADAIARRGSEGK